MALLGKLRVIERLLRMLEVAAAVLPVCIEEKGIEPLIEIVVMRDVLACARRRIELRKPPPEITQQPRQPRPVRGLAAVVLRKREMKKVGDRAPLHHQAAI